MTRVFIDRLDGPGGLAGAVAQALDWIQASSIIQPGARVFIKPNLTWNTPTPGVTVTPAFIRALVEALLPLTPNITIGESEGGQASFQAEDAFESHGLYQLAREHGVKVVNLSQHPHEKAVAQVAGRPYQVELPSMLLHEVDVFVTLPVPKIHALTGASLGFKNQWGCLGDKMRVTLHPRFNPSILAINKLLKPRICIFDGTHFLDHTGPMTGLAVPMNLVIAGDDVGAATLAACQVMRLDPMRVPHLAWARREAMLPESLEGVVLNRQPSEFAERKFEVHLTLINYFHRAAFRNVALNRLFYDSLFADGLHELLWFIRRSPPIRRLLYGRYGTGGANRGGHAR
jgi:uncharacterized protein (DUF362 family)